MSIFGDLSQLENQHKCKIQGLEASYICALPHERVKQPTCIMKFPIILPTLACLVALVTARPVPQTCSTSSSLSMFAILTFMQLSPTPAESLNYQPLSLTGLFSCLISAFPPLSKYLPLTVPTNQARHPAIQSRNLSSAGSITYGTSSAIQSRTSRSRSLSRGKYLKTG